MSEQPPAILIDALNAVGQNGRHELSHRSSCLSSSIASSGSRSVKAALKELPTRRFHLVRSSLGGGLVPLDENAFVSPEECSTNYSRNSNGTFACNNRSAKLDTTDPISFARFNKQCDIAHIIPVTDCKRMTRSHWADVYSLERRYLPVDWYQPKESPILGVKQSHINRDHRHRIVKWMGEACGLFRWTIQTFFVAVHAWDVYVTVAPHEVTTGDLAKLSAACLYYGAQLVESAADENVKPLDEFTELCPEVGSTAAVREIQAHLVDTLQGISLIRRTPIDFLLLFLAQMQIAPSPCPELFESLLHQNLLDVLWEIVVGVTLTIYANGLALDGLPGSHWVAGSMLRVLEYSCPILKTDPVARETIRRYVFHLPPGSLEAHRTTVLDPVIKAVWQLILDAAASDNSDEGRKHPSNASHDGSAKKKMPYEMIKHNLPSLFSQWPITFPSNKMVQEVSSRLRSTCFETCTPPNVYATGASISASKRAGEKVRRQTSTAPSKNSKEGVKVKDGLLNDENVGPRKPLIGGEFCYNYC